LATLLTTLTLLFAFAVPALAAPVSGAEPSSVTQHGSASVKAEIAALDARLDATAARYGEATQTLLHLRDSIRDNERRLKLAQFNLALARTNLQRRVVAIYKEQPVDLLDVLMSANSFNELLSQVAMMDRLTAGDQALVSSIQTYERQVASEHSALEQQLTSAHLLASRLAQQRASLWAALAQRRLALRGSRAAQANVTTTFASATPATDVGTPPTLGGEQSAWWGLIKSAARASGIDATGLCRLMVAESGGDANARNGAYYGLFQYSLATWRGSWNPWRSASIFDGAAQIKATALAIHLGHGPGWWPVTFPYAFAE